MTATAHGQKLGKQLGDYDLGELLVTGGLVTPGQIEAASDGDVEEAVGSENLAAVRDVFPGQE